MHFFGLFILFDMAYVVALIQEVCSIDHLRLHLRAHDLAVVIVILQRTMLELLNQLDGLASNKIKNVFFYNTSLIFP